MRAFLVVVIAIASGCGPGPQPAPAEPAPIRVAPASPEPPTTYTPRHTRPAMAVPPVDKTGPLFTPPAPRPAPPVAGRPAPAPRPAVPDEQIKALRKLAAATSDSSPDKPDLLYRLGESLATHDQYRPEAIKTFVALVDGPKFKTYPRQDQALFQLGLLLTHAMRPNEALGAYKRLIKDHPSSALVPDTFLLFADYYFDQGQMDQAGPFYDKVLQFPKARVYAYALYKRAWVYANLLEWTRALERFFEVQRTAGSTQPELAAAARSGFVLAYAELGKPDMANKTFERVSKPDAGAMLEELVDRYEQAGKLAPAMFIYRQLISARPQDARLCDWQLGVVRASLVAGSVSDRVNEAGRLADIADHLKTPACQDAARAVLIWFGHALNAEAQKTLNAETLVHAEHAYARYLKSFAAAPEATLIRHHHAELLWQIAQIDRSVSGGRAKWPPVVVAFDALAADPGATPELRAAAAEAARLARDNFAHVP